jgi:hypothetical protein
VGKVFRLVVPLALAACGTKPAPVLGDYVPPQKLWDPSAGPIFSAGPTPGTGLAVPTPSDDPTSCAAAAASRSYVGCDYWPTVVANVVWSIFDYAVVVANAGATTANVTVTGPMGTSRSERVAPDSLVKIYLPWVPALKGADADTCGVPTPLPASVVAKGAAFHLVSDQPVTVYQFNALEFGPSGGPPGKSWDSCPGLQSCVHGGLSGCWSYSNDASLLLPSTAMTGNYLVTGFPGEDEPAPGGTLVPTMNGYFAITATADATHVTVSVSPGGSVVAGGGIAATPAGGTIQLTLDHGDVAEIAGGLGNTIDLSGSQVTADKPVQVIAGSPCEWVPEHAHSSQAGFSLAVPACDHLEQSVFPAETLGHRYFVTVPSGPNGQPIGHVPRFYGNANSATMLTYTPAPQGCPFPVVGATDTPTFEDLMSCVLGGAPSPLNCPTMLAVGEVADCGGIVTNDFEVTGTSAAGDGAPDASAADGGAPGSSAFAVGSFMLGGSLLNAQGIGDPSHSLMVAVEQYRTKYVFLAPSDYDINFADIVAPSGTDVFLDGMHLNPGRLMPIGDGYGALRVPLAGVNQGGNGAHVILASKPVGLQVLGYGSYTSYQYPGGLNLNAIAPPPPPPR